MSFLKQIAAGLLFSAAVFVVPELFGFELTSDHFQWIAIVGLMGSSNLLWSRQPTTWKKKFLDKLIWAEPIEPAHQRSIIEVRNPPYGYDPAFFELTQDWVDVTNGLLSYETKWRLQEMEDTALRIGHWVGPHHGRRYKIFHAQQEVGVRVPDYQRRKRYKRSLTHQYRNFRENCIGLMLGVADGTYEWGKQKELLDQKKFKDYFGEWVTPDQSRWHRFLNKLDDYHLKQIIKNMEIFRGEIQFILNNVDIPSEKPFEFLKRLSAAVYSMQDKTLDYDDTKSFGRFLWEVFAGFDFITGYRERDIIQEMIDAI